MKKISLLFLFLLPVLLTKGWVQAQSVGLRIPDTTSVQGTVLEMPIYADSTLTGEDVFSYSIQLSYDPYYLQPIAIIISGTIAEPLGAPIINTSVSGLVSFAAAGTVPLNGAGKLIIVRWLLKNSGWTQLNFTDLKHNYLNEGSPSVTLNQGNITIQTAPLITIYPDTKIIARGDQLQMNVYGGTAPYTWSVTDTNLADIDTDGLLTAKAGGLVKVIATDNVGVKDTTNTIEIRQLKLSIPQNLTQWEGSTIDIPVLTTDLTGLNISSGKFNISFNPDILLPVGLVQEGTLLETYQAFMQKSNRLVSVAFAGSSVLTGNGTLIYIRFNVLKNPNYGSDLAFDKAVMNENLLAATSDGNFIVKNFNSLYIYPNQGNLTVGESIKLDLGGVAILPLTWSVNDTVVASVDPLGNLTGKKRGQVTVTVIDSAGAPAYSGKFTVFDTRIVIPDTAICHFNTEMDYPLYLQILPHDSINSFQSQLIYDTNSQTFLGIETAGTASEGWIAESNESEGKINFALTGSKALKKTGVLLKFKFAHKAAFGPGYRAGINLSPMILNEGSPSVLVQSYGSISGISPNTATAYIESLRGSNFCEADTAVLSVHIYYGGYPKIQWLKNGNPIPNETSDMLRINSLADKDTISCRVVSTDPCVVDSIIYSNTIGMTVHPKPLAAGGISGQTAVVAGTNDVTYTVTEIPNAVIYHWFLSNGVTGFSSTNSITVNFGTSISSASIKVQGVNGCGVGAADSLVVTVSPITGFSGSADRKVGLFPNPVVDKLNIVLSNSLNIDTKIEVYDATGRMLKIKNAYQSDGIQLDFSNQTVGIYLVRIIDSSKTELFKIIKQ